MSFLKNKIFLGAVCILLAAVIAFAVLPLFYRSQSRTETVVRLTEDVPAGTVLTARMLAETEVGAFGLPDKIARSKDAVLGSVAVENLHAGEYLWEDRILSEEAYRVKAAADNRGLAKSSCLVTVEFPTASAGIAGILRAGDVVDVYGCTQDEERNYTVERSLSSLYVYEVMNTKLESLTELDQRIAELPEEENSYDLQPAFVVFRCTEQQARILIRLEAEKALHLTYRRTEG